MSDIDDFFNRNKTFVRKQISGGTTNGRIVADTPKKSNQRSDEFPSSSQYADAHIAENRQQLMDVISFPYVYYNFYVFILKKNISSKSFFVCLFATSITQKPLNQSS